MKESLHVPALIFTPLNLHVLTCSLSLGQVLVYTAPKLAATNPSEFEEFSLKRRKNLQMTPKCSYFF